MTTIKKIIQEVLNFDGVNITIVPGFTFNQKQTVEQIIFYYNSKFQSGETDDEGDRKYFFNIVKNPCKVCSKAIDFDTKNIRLLTSGGSNPIKTWFMERDLSFWMRDKQFGRVLNRIFAELPIFGTVVLKVIGGVPYFVDLRNFIVEQSANDLDSTDHIMESHFMTVPEFRKSAKLFNWPTTKVDEVIQKFREKKAPYIRVYERYGEVNTSDENKPVYAWHRTFLADVGEDRFDERGNQVSVRGVELSSTPYEGHPYWEFHMEKISGRWLGIGVVETLFEPQIRQNELCNLQSKTSYWAALRIFQTRDDAINRNLMTDVKNGEIINVDSEITQIDMSDRNLGFFNEEYGKWLKNRDELTFSYDVVQGERLPAGTPLGSAQIAISQTLSYFELIQENVALDIKELLYEKIIPSFETENTIEHTLRLVGEDLDSYIELIKNDLVNKEMIKLALKSGSAVGFPTNKDRDVAGLAISDAIKQGKEKIITIPKGFYKDVKYDVDIDITGESVDTRVRYATRFAIMQAITADPTMITDPIKRKILYGIAEDGGLNPSEIFGVQSKQPEEAIAPQALPARGAGGGVSAPALGARIAGPTTTTV